MVGLPKGGVACPVMVMSAVRANRIFITDY